MSSKWAKNAHFGDISYNVFNRRKSSYLIKKLQISLYLDGWPTSTNLTIRNLYLLYILSIFTRPHLPGFSVTEYNICEYFRATKYGMVGLMEALECELALLQKTGIKTTCVFPWTTKSNMTDAIRDRIPKIHR